MSEQFESRQMRHLGRTPATPLPVAAIPRNASAVSACKLCVRVCRAQVAIRLSKFEIRNSLLEAQTQIPLLCSAQRSNAQRAVRADRPSRLALFVKPSCDGGVGVGDEPKSNAMTRRTQTCSQLLAGADDLRTKFASNERMVRLSRLVLSRCSSSSKKQAEHSFASKQAANCEF